MAEPGPGTGSPASAFRPPVRSGVPRNVSSARALRASIGFEMPGNISRVHAVHPDDQLRERGMSGDDDSLANSSLSTSRVPPQDGQKPDSMPTTRNLPGNDQQKGLEETADPSHRESGRVDPGTPGGRKR